MSQLLSKNSETEEVTVPAGEQVLFARTASNTRIALQEEARLTFVLLATEGWENKPKITFEFAGKNSTLAFLGFVVGTNNLNFNFETMSRHVSPQTKAHYYLRAAMFDHSTVDYKGNLAIEKSAQLTDTYLAHHTLLLSDHARARTIPSLEIEADDVKAGHAATIGKVDKELMFYLKSRGIDEKEAEHLLITGFFETQIRMIPEEKMRQIAREAIMAAIPNKLFI